MKKNILFCSIIFLIFSSFAESFATSSTDVVRPRNLAPQSYQAEISLSNCTAPIQSSPYVIVMGNGGANMDLHCPASHPIMSSWRQNVGFGGLGAVSHGGGRSWITCCAVNHQFAAIH